MDSWEDADEAFVPQLPTKSNWDDDEEDEALKKEEELPRELTAAQKALLLKKQEQEEITLANKVKNAQLANETPDEKRLRERKAVEEADGELANELFDNVDNIKGVKSKGSSKSNGGGIASINLHNKQDHVNFGITVATKLEKSTAFCLTAFMKEVVTRTQDRFSAEGIDEIHAILTKMKESRKIAEDAKAKDKGKPKSQKAAKERAKKAKEVFGGDFDYEDEYDEYATIEDDYNFM